MLDSYEKAYVIEQFLRKMLNLTVMLLLLLYTWLTLQVNVCMRGNLDYSVHTIAGCE